MHNFIEWQEQSWCRDHVDDVEQGKRREDNYWKYQTAYERQSKF